MLWFAKTLKDYRYIEIITITRKPVICNGINPEFDGFNPIDLLYGRFRMPLLLL
jgi:hypothetical protein